MHAFGLCIATLVNSVLLGIVYLLGVGVTSCIATIRHKRFLEMKIEKEKKSYWSDLHLKKKPIEEYYRQF